MLSKAQHARQYKVVPPLLRTMREDAGLTQRDLGKRLRSRSPFVYLARWVSPAEAERIRKLDLPGIGILDEPRRVYPHEELGAQVIGFANIDGEGVRGIEQQEDTWLRGTERVLRVERDARGHLLASAGASERAEVGGDVALTIDVAMQADAERILGDAIKKTRARGGVVISLDPRTGQILALAEGLKLRLGSSGLGSRPTAHGAEPRPCRKRSGTTATAAAAVFATRRAIWPRP